MQLDTSRLRTGAEDIDRQFSPDDFAGLNEDFQVTGPTRLTGTVRRDSKTAVVLKGRVRSTLEVACSRCLEPFSVDVDAEFETRFVPPGEFATVTAETVHSGEVGDDQVEETEIGLTEYDGETIDLAQMMKEQFLLTLPMKPLCREDCQGLCPVCGANRNRETCECRQDWVDPRLASLANLKKQ